jgi:glucose-6-phosphate isomerase
MEFMTPFGLQINLQDGTIAAPNKKIERRLSQMRAMFSDQEAARRILSEEGDRLIYEVYAAELPEEEGHVLYCTTIIQPGQVGREFHMTKGHYHARRDRGEVYLGLAGQGLVLLQLEDGTLQSVAMRAGAAAYVPPYWGHRTVNIGDDPFIFFSAWPGDAGHDYGAIEETGFSKLMVAQDGVPTLVENPRYHVQLPAR